jgi:hypothetical protein
MGTRAIINIHDENLDSPILVTIYRQFDGYPSNLGEDIKEALGKRKLVNGHSNAVNETNGMGCAAALLIAHLKADMTVGNVYIVPAGTNDVSEEFTYDIFADKEAMHMTINQSKPVEISDFNPDVFEDC